MPKKNLEFEPAMARLEEIVALLERGEAPLEKSMSLFEEGAGLLKRCTALLDQAEQKVRLLTIQPDGSGVEQPFEEGDRNG